MIIQSSEFIQQILNESIFSCSYLKSSSDTVVIDQIDILPGLMELTAYEKKSIDQRPTEILSYKL